MDCSGRSTVKAPVDLCLNFKKDKMEKSNSTNWIFSLQKSISKLILAGYTGSEDQFRNRLKIQFVEFDFSKLIFQKSSTDQQRASKFSLTINALRYLSLTK